MSKLSPANQWAHGTLNFIYGCKKVSPGCVNCYIDRNPWNLRLHSMNMESPFEGKVHYYSLENQVRKLDSFEDNSVIWTNGLGDTFAEFIPDSKRDLWHKIFESRPEYQFVICTKRPGNMVQYYKNRRVPENVWVGTTVESPNYVSRIELLKKVDATIRWISFEPLLQEIKDVDLRGIQWVAVGGETEPTGKYRPFNEEWALNLKSICERDSVNFWYEGGNGFSDSMRIGGGLIKGKSYTEYPQLKTPKQNTLDYR